MTKEMAMERIKKAEEFISKKRGTISKKEKSIEKKLEEIRKLGVTFEGSVHHICELEEMGIDKETADALYWLECDVTGLQEDIRRSKKAIAEKEAKLPEYRKALEEAEQKEAILANEVPESMKEAKAELVESWTRYDLLIQEQIMKDSKELEWKEYSKKWSYSAREEYLYKKEEDFRKRNEKEATIWLLDLYERVKDIVGTITDTSNLRWAGKALNGVVYGTAGTANVQTIEAGGWNIQRWHLRVLVHKA